MRICLDAGEHQALGMLPLTDMFLSTWASPKNQISQDLLSLPDKFTHQEIPIFHRPHRDSFKNIT